MHHELQAMERQGLYEEIDNLRLKLQAMQCDFSKCAKGISPCFFCSKDFTCECTRDTECNFVWAEHN